MKRLIGIYLLAALSFSTVAFALPAEMSLEIRQGDLRATPSFLGKIIARVQYGDRMKVLEQNEAWSRVLAPDGRKTGWIHTSALTKKKIMLNATSGDANLAASSGELTLAGKGFNSDVEAEYRAQNQQIDFTLVDKMERTNISPDIIKAFLREGKVVPDKGESQ